MWSGADSTNARAVAEICRRLDGLPLVRQNFARRGPLGLFEERDGAHAPRAVRRHA